MANTSSDLVQAQPGPVDSIHTTASDQATPTFDSVALLRQYPEVKLAQQAPLPGRDQAKPPAASDSDIDIPIGQQTADASTGGNAPCPVSPDYTTYIDMASRFMYDPSKLGNINALEHKYDCSIQSTNDIFNYASEALKVTGDRFDGVMNPEQAKQFERQQKGEYAGIGVEIVPAHLFNLHNPMAAAAGINPAGETVIRSVAPGKAAFNAGLKPGDAIMKVNGQDVSNLPPTAVSNILTDGGPGTKVDIIVDRQGQRVEAVPIRQKLENPPVVHDKDLGDGIAYIKIDNFGSETGSRQLSAAMDKYKNAKGFVIDVRDNPGGLINQALQSAELFVKSGNLMTSLQRHDSPASAPTYDQVDENLDARGLNTVITHFDKSVDKGIEARLPDKAGDRPVVVLTNGQSASAAEIFTGALHDTAKDTTLGDPTFGKGIGQSVLKDMPDGGYLKVTSLHYFTPSGKWPGDADKDKHPLVPDKPVPQPQDALKGTSSDAQLQAAVDQVKEKIKGT